MELRRYTGHILIGLIAHYGYVWCFPYNDKSLTGWKADPFWSSFLFTTVLWQALVWSICAFYYYLDMNAESKYPALAASKLPQPTKASVEPSWGTQIPVALRNQAVIYVAAIALLLQRDVYRVENESVWRSAGFFFLHIATSDVFFYFGHVAMHHLKAWPFKGVLYRAHKLHHSSFARCAVAGYYMSTLDFFLEHFPPFMSMAIWREAGPAWAVLICVGAYNLLVTHSGYDFPWTPDPKTHYLHHSKQHLNYGIVLDHVFNTHVNFDKSIHLPKETEGKKLS